MSRFAALLPRSLVSRVMLIYMAALALLVSVGLVIFIIYEFNSTLEDTEADSQAMLAMLVPMMADSAVIGDYDTIKRTLDHAIAHPLFERAAFIDLKGARLEVVRQDHPDATPPRWLVARIAAHLQPVNAPIHVGGRDYGVTRLTLWNERIAADMWQATRVALLFALFGTLGGGALVAWPLRRWLGQLDRVSALGAQLQLGGQEIRPVRTDEAPLEFQRTFEIVNQVAASLQAERAQAAVTLASIAEGVATINRSGAIVLSNPVFAQLLGTPAATLLGQSVQHVLPELDIDPATEAGWQGRRFEHGEQVLEASLAPVRAELGQAAGAVLVLRDVSEQQALENRLRAELDARAHAMQAMSELLGSAGSAPSAAHSNAVEQLSRQVGDMVARLRRQTDQLRAIFNLTPDGFIAFGADRRVQYISPACALLTALRDRDVLEQDEAGLAALLQGRFAEPEHQRPLRLQDLRDEPRIVKMARPMPRILSLALHDGGGTETPQLLHIRDVSQQFEVDRLKSEFLTTAAHELRTPMTSVLGFAELLIQRDYTPERQRELLQRIHRQSRAMMDILDELLDLARIESRHALDFQFCPVELPALCRQTVDDFGAPDGREPPALDLALALPAPWVHVDPAKLGQALRNLLSNAYKYSPGGGSVTLRLLRHGAGEVDIEVEDRGIGMNAEELERVTERFYRADRSGAIPGTGLGMAIVKEIVELMGGSLHLRSEPGRGTTATLRLPLTDAPDSAPATSAAAAA